jgi:hypothetical protein
MYKDEDSQWTVANERSQEPVPSRHVGLSLAHFYWEIISATADWFMLSDSIALNCLT